MRAAARSTIPIVRAIYRKKQRGLSVGALRVDRCPEFDESLDQAQLAGDYAPMQSIISERIACTHQVWLAAQDSRNFSLFSADDHLLQHVETGPEVKPSAHGPLKD